MQSLDQQGSGAQKRERQRKIDKEVLLERLKKGDAIPDIAKDFDCHPEAIYNYLRRNGKSKRVSIFAIKKQEDEFNKKVRALLLEVVKFDWENEPDKPVDFFTEHLDDFIFHFKGGWDFDSKKEGDDE